MKENKGHVLILIGRPRAGKSTISRALAVLTGGKHGETGQVVRDYLAALFAPSIFELFKKHVQQIEGWIPKKDDKYWQYAVKASAEAASAFVNGGNATFKEDVRKPQELYGDLLCKAKGAATLSTELLGRGCNFIDGIRRKAELEAFKAILFDEGYDYTVVWVAREDAPLINDNTEVTMDDADMVIINQPGANEGMPIPFFPCVKSSDEPDAPLVDTRIGAEAVMNAIKTRGECTYHHVVVLPVNKLKDLAKS